MQASFTKKKQATSYKLAEYQEQGIPQLVTIIDQKTNEYIVLNSQNNEFTLASNRVYQLPGKIPPQFSHRNQIVSYLRELSKESNKIKENIKLDKAWENFRSSNREVTLEQIQKCLFTNQNLANFIAIRWALLSDKFYFKRGKNGFTARTGDSIESIKLAVAKEEERNQLIKSWAQSVIEKCPQPEMIEALEKVSALGNRSEVSADVESLFDYLQTLNYKISQKRLEDQAFYLLIELGIFTKHENLIPIKIGRKTSFSAEELEAAKSLNLNENNIELLNTNIFTIDGDDTRDFDDALSIENNVDGYIVGVHIANVSSCIKPGDLLWDTSLRRSSTIYTADLNYPMLPHSASEEFFSLIQDKTRDTLSIFIKFNQAFELQNYEIKQTKIKVNQRLTYDELDRQFDLKQQNQGLDTLLKLSQKLEQQRIANGAKVLPKREMQPSINEKGEISLTQVNEETPARKLVGEMMVLANYCMASFAKDNNIPFIFRYQERPETEIDEYSFAEGPAREYALRGVMKRSILSCLPAAHYGLALDCYCQATSPIRRFIDLINQYQLNQFLNSKTLLSTEELETIIPNLESSLGEVAYIQRKRHRYWLLAYLEQNKIETLEGIVVKIDGPKPLVEIDNLFLISQYYPIKNKKITPGQRVRLKLEQISARLDRLKLNEHDA